MQTAIDRAATDAVEKKGRVVARVRCDLSDDDPDRVLGAIEIANLLKSPEWGGIRGEGQHDLAIFVDVLYYMEAQMLSTLKHFAPHIKTISLTRGHQPNADQSLPNLSEKKLDEFLAGVMGELVES